MTTAQFVLIGALVLAIVAEVGLFRMVGDNVARGHDPRVSEAILLGVGAGCIAMLVLILINAL